MPVSPSVIIGKKVDSAKKKVNPVAESYRRRRRRRPRRHPDAV
jgi:hypothetical protein